MDSAGPAALEGASRPFPVGEATRVRAESLPLATVIPAGERILLTISGSSPELLIDPRQPRLTIASGPGTHSSISLPVVTGPLRFSPS